MTCGDHCVCDESVVKDKCCEGCDCTNEEQKSCGGNCTECKCKPSSEENTEAK